MSIRNAAAMAMLASAAWAQTSADLFDDSVLHEVRLVVHPSDWRTLKQHFDRDTHYPADFTWRGLTAQDVSIRSRGMGSRSGVKPGLLVEFARFVPGRRFLGLERLVLDNTLQDVSGLRERLSMALFRRMGHPAPREAHSRLYVNGEYVGLYAIVEDIDRVFLASQFNDPDGYLYEYHWRDDYRFEDLGEDPSEYLDRFDPVTHISAPQGGRLVELVRLIRVSPQEDFIAHLSQLLDLRQLTSYIAIENFLAEWDGILGTEGLNNFYLYRPLAAGPFRFIPWDKDVTMQHLEHPLDSGLTTNALVAKTLAHAEYWRYYYAELARAAEIAGGPEGWLAQEAERAYGQVRQAALEDQSKSAGNDVYEASSAQVLEFVRNRSGVVRAALERLRPGAGVLLRQPYLQDVGRDRATLVWTTLSEGTGSVRYSTDRSFNRLQTEEQRVVPETETQLGYSYVRHKVELTNLQENTRYYYRVFHENENLLPGDELSFRTAGPGPFRFLAFGDSGAGTTAQHRLSAGMLKENAALVVHTGDIAYPGGRFIDFQLRHFDVYRELLRLVPFFPSPGNHEYYSDNAYPYVTVFETPTIGVPEADRGRYYSFDWGPVHFVALDSNDPLTNAASGSGPMLEWLDADLAGAEAPWKIVYFHHPPYATGPNERDPQSALVRERIVPILERHGVQLVLNGHEHNYQRSVPIRQGAQVHEHEGALYLTTGGGGGQLYDVYPGPLLAASAKQYHYVRLEVDGIRIRAAAVGLEGAELDRSEVARPPSTGPAGLVNAVAGVTGLCPGGLVSVYGKHLGTQASSAATAMLPTALAGTRLLVNGEAVPLLFVSPTQVNAQLPFGLPPSIRVRLETEIAAVEFETSVSEAAPGILSVARSDGSLVTGEAPVRGGEQLVVLAAGLGPVEGVVSAGQPPPAGQTARLTSGLTVELSGRRLIPSFAGLAPGIPGLYQVVFQTPQDLPDGPHFLQLHLPGASSNVVEVASGRMLP